jgi:cytochrome c oxidase subunit 1
MLIAVPTGVKILNWLATLWGGRIRFSAALCFALGFVAMFTMGGLSGIMHASPPVDLQQTDSYFVVAHLHYVLFGGSIFALMAGFYYWWPKAFGRLLDERLGKLHFWLMLVGFNLTFFPHHILGLLGMPRRIYTYAPDLGWNLWNLLSTVGAFIIAAAFAVFIANIVRTARSGAPAEADPWDGRTLEWSIPSPPLLYNFARLPIVHDRDEFWSRKYGRLAERGEEEDGLLAPIHVPPSSYWPILLAASLFVTASGALVSIVQVVIGGLLTFYCIFRFAMEYHRDPYGYLIIPEPGGRGLVGSIQRGG